MSEDSDLLRRFAADGDEHAFRELVNRRLGLVYGVALRQVGGDAHAAADVAQKVFTALASQAAPLSRRAVIGGWLYRATRFTAAKYVRAERRRRARELEAHAMTEANLTETPAVDWERAGPVVDQVMGDLNDRDRDALVLRYIEQRTFSEVADQLRITEDAARMRVDRALERMRAVLARRGILSSSAALATGLAGQTAGSAPVGLASVIGSSSVAIGSATSSGGAFLAFMSITPLQFGIIGAVLIVAGGGLLMGRSWAGQREASARTNAQRSAVATGVGSEKAVAIASKAEESRADRLRREFLALLEAGAEVDIEAVKRFVHGLSIVELAEFLSESDSLQNATVRKLFVTEIHQAWAAIAPEPALASAKLRGSELIQTVLRLVAFRDPRWAWDWAVGHLGPVGKDTNRLLYIAAVVDGLSAAGRQAQAVSWLEEASSQLLKADKEHISQQLLMHWGKSAPDAAGQWLRQIESLDAKSAMEAAGSFGIGLASHPIEVLEAQLRAQSASIGDRILSGTTIAWMSNKELPKAIEFLRANRELSDSRHDTIVGSISGVLVHQDPSMAHAMIKEIRNPAGRDNRLAGFASSVAGTDPVFGMSVALAVANPASRERSAVLVFQRWYEKDAPAARAFLAEGAPEELKPRFGAIAAAVSSMVPDPAIAVAEGELERLRTTPGVTGEQLALKAQEILMMKAQQGRRIKEEADRAATRATPP